MISLALSFFTVVYGLNPWDLFGSLGVNHWTTWNLMTKKRIEKKYVPMILKLYIVNVVNHFFAIRMLVCGFLSFWLWLRQKSNFFFKLDLRSNSCFAVKLKEDDEAMFEKCLKLAWAKKHTAMMSFKSGNFQGDVTKAKQFTLSDANHFECKHYLFKNAKKGQTTVNFLEFPRWHLRFISWLCYPILA